MRRKRLIGVMLSALCVGALAPPLGATDYTWEGCTTLNCLFDEFCFCDGNWSDDSNWTGSGYPDGSDDTATVDRSNVISETCPIVEGAEEWFQINLTSGTTTVGDLTIESEKSGIRLRYLRTIFWGSATLRVDSLTIDGVDGPVIVEVGGGGTLETQ